jgi:RES domain-containing protein
VRLFRVTQQRDSAAAFDGMGSSLYPGRWNERSTRVVYVTSRISLGILEVIVQSSASPLLDYFAYPVDVPDRLLETFDRSALSAQWRSAGAGREECRRHGEAWLEKRTSLGLIVPSAVVPEALAFGDFNAILNPVHEDMVHATVEAAVPLELDERLRARGVSLLPATTRSRQSSSKTGRPRA